MKNSAYTNQNYGRQSKYSPAKRDTTPNRLQVGSSAINNGAPTSRSRIRTYTSPVYENDNNNNQNQPLQSYSSQKHQQQDYRMAESYM